MTSGARAAFRSALLGMKYQRLHNEILSVLYRNTTQILGPKKMDAT